MSQTLQNQPMGAPADAIAIVGMAGRFPGARSVDEFWDGQRTGRISISRFDPNTLDDAFGPDIRSDPAFVAARGVLDKPDEFDAECFGMYAREARLTDPQHRVFLETCLEALENAGIDPQRFDGPIGVFAGASMSTYLIGNVLGGTAEADEFVSNYQLGGMETLVGSLPDALATRVAYKLDLRGPAMTVQSACSTSLLAVAQACQSLLFYQCDAALAGGVSITFPQHRGYLYQDGGMGSRDGTVRPFDADACGTVFGSGAGAVVLKRLVDALRDGEEIVAVIRGCGIANDGAAKIGFTAPSAEGQARAIASAIAEAGVDPASIGYVELHGTATPLGDPIEFDGLVRAFGPSVPAGSCVLGSAKANIGHLDAAAGVTGLIKAALCLRNGEIPPLANFDKPNPHIDLDSSPFRIAREPVAWPRGREPRRAGVSSFGVGGTNVHVVLEEAPEAHREDAAAGLHVLPISAASEGALDAQAAALSAHLASHPALSIGDVALTLREGRSERQHRGAVVAESVEEAAGKLAEFGKRSIRAAASDAPRVVFMFPGQGSQYPGMGANLYRKERVYREWIDRGADLLRDGLGVDVRELLYAKAAAGEADHPIRSTVYAQPALFLTQYALAQLWISRGIEPAAMIGHSVGELVAACVAGVLSFEDGLALVARRAQLMQSAEPGAMLAVRVSETDASALLGEGVDLAAVNAPSLCVLAGPFEAIDRVADRLAAMGADGRRLHTSHAFHSAMMEPVVGELEQLAATFAYSPSTIPYVSCVTGDWAGGDSGASGAYWARHCREPVRFVDALQTVVAAGPPPVLLEVGPGRTLATFARQGLERDAARAVIASMPEAAAAADDERHFAEAAAHLWAVGARPDLRFAPCEGARKVPLPAYQFQRKSYWIHPDPAARSARDRAQAAAPAPVPNMKGTLPVLPTAMNAPLAAADRVLRIGDELSALLEELSGETVEPADYASSFLELGFDSLFLGQVASRVQREFAVKVTFRQLMGDLASIDALARHLDSQMPADAAPAAAAADTPQVPVLANLEQPAVTVAAPDGMAAAFQVQLDAMKAVIDRQLDMLAGATARPAAPVPPPAPVAADRAEAAVSIAATGEPVAAKARFRPFDPKTAGQTSAANPKQAGFIADLAARYAAKMPASKALTQQYRACFSDPRTAAGFRIEWKEMVFPVIAERSKGSKFWDPDGNVFIDLVNGYGQTAFGHAPDFVVDAVSRQLVEGFAIGPQSFLAGKVAARIAGMVGMDRVTFCNTGSEAVMAAMRVARCVTGRDKVVVFNNDYHGQFDEVLVKAGGKAAFARALPIAPGIPPESVENMVVLPYGAPESLEWIRAHLDDIAAVIVEPVQSRHPDLLPFDFLRILRAATHEGGAALVFDEVVTGFRTHPGGMQAVLGIKADMATYGKVLGGGMPIGVLAGGSAWLDALDGGAWQYGDDSFPEVAPTFFAGTFVRHPLVLAACDAVLDHIEAGTATLQQQLAERTKSLVRRMENEFSVRGLAVDLPTYSSWFMLDLADRDALASLFHFHMRLLGVHMLEGYPCFLTTAHSDADIDAIVAATGQTIDALQSAGILLPEGLLGAAREPAVADRVTVPLTEPQIEILLAAQMGPEASCAYNESITVAFDGAIDERALAASIQDFIARHDAMRATIDETGPALRIAPTLPFDLSVTEDADDSALAAAKDEEARTAFDLVSGPLVRGRLLKRTDGGADLIFTGHHIIFDGWTAGLFTEEVAAFYRARTGSERLELPPAVSFARYARELADSGDPVDDLDYWRGVFSELPAPLELPGDRPRPTVKTFAGTTLTEDIDGDLVKAVRKAGAANGCTLFSTLFAALQATIGRLAESTNVVLGCPTAGQAAIEDAALAGHCVNFLPLRAPFTMETPIGEHLKSVNEAVLGGFDHQSATYGSIVRALGLPHSASRTPLTDVQFNLERLPEAVDFGGVSGALSANPKAAVNFDLFFNVVETALGLRVEVDYATDLYDEATIRRWVENFRQVLRGLVADASIPIGLIDILGPDERAWIDARNAKWVQLPHDTSIVSRFADAAAANPARIAVIEGGHRVTYAQLDSGSNRLARVLQARGIGRGDRVALLSGRSSEMLVAILAILKLGGTYVPLDPAYPAIRVQYMLGDCHAKLVLLGAEAPCDTAADTMLLADAISLAKREDDGALSLQSRADDPAYIMYTSGSTGKPKGVLVPHRAVVRLVSDQSFIDFGPDEVFLNAAPPAFDASTLEIWGPLLHGGAVAIAPSAKPALEEIAATIADGGVTTAWLTAALFHAIVDERAEALAPLRQLLAGGDVLSPSHITKLRATLPHIKLVNGYGPTENTTFSACYRFPEGGWGSGPAPIGTPIAHSTAFVLDSRMQLRPRGAVGELFVGGEGLALGYVGLPELTAEKFVSNPFAPGERLYRTGDLVRWRADGTLEFLGRADKQVKINGHRVELTEIECVLRTVPGIRDAAAVASESAGGSKEIHAFVAPDAGAEDDGDLIEAARRTIAAELPGAMHPRSIHVLPAIPSNDNGKVDRIALLRRIEEGAAAGPATAAPEPVPALSDLETRIAAIWSEVLGVECIGREDALFDLGADSLQIFRIAARMSGQGLRVENRQLLANPSLRDVAALVSDSPSEAPAVVSRVAPLSAYRRQTAT